MKTSFKKILAGTLFASLFLNFNANAQWSLTGNAATAPGTVIAPGTNFLGTNDLQDFALRTNNIERLRISSSGAINLGAFPTVGGAILNVQNKRGTTYGTPGTVATFIQHHATSTAATPVMLNKVNLLDAFPARGCGYINGASYVNGVWNTYFSVGYDGVTNIGDHSVLEPASRTLTNNCKLLVQGGILSEKVKIALLSDATNWSWPDYVFKKDYNLLSLKEVESYINKNKHLPGVPSEAEVKTNGLDVAEMEASLLKKIEELTLYMIDVQKQLDLLKEENKKLKEEKK